MAECSQIARMLSEYLDRDLPPETCSAIEAHLASCPDCDAAAASLRQTVSACRQFRNENRPGPLPAEKHDALKAAFEKVLSEIQRQR